MTRSTRTILLCTGGALVPILAALVAIILWVRSSMPRETTDPAQYATILKDWLPSLSAHFPAALPPNAKNVHFSAYPKFMQGGAHIQLRMQLPAEQIRQIEAQVKERAIQTCAGGGMYDHANGPTTFFYTSDEHSTSNPLKMFSFPSRYMIYVLYAKDLSLAPWDKGETCGTVISTTANEVIYWADHW